MQAYFDNSATTKIRREALDKYISVSEEVYGNPSSLHSLGLLAEKQLEEAREHILKSLSERGSTVVFTSSGSEANNLAIFGRAFAKERYAGRAKIITTEGEHASVDAPFLALEKMGFKIARIPTVGGKIDLNSLEAELTPEVILVSVMMVNNETGALYDTASVSALIKARCKDALLHIDATQSYLKLPFTKKSVGADMITLSSHKIEGPKGVGALVVSDAVIKSKGLAPIILGGGQEGGLRSGTENVPAIAAFGEAVRLGYTELAKAFEYTTDLRSYIIDRLAEEVPEIKPTLPESSSPCILNITLPDIKSETMLHYLSAEGVFVSSGSACSSNSAHTSSALIAYGKSEREADSSIRISLSKRNTKEEADRLVSALKCGVGKLSRIKR